MTDRERRAEFYEQKAAEMRARAEAMTDFAARKTMLQAASLWAFMARQARQPTHLSAGGASTPHCGGLSESGQNNS